MTQKKTTTSDTWASITVIDPTEGPVGITNRRQFIVSLVKNIQDSEIGFAGFKTKEKLIEYLEKSVFSENTGVVPVDPVVIEERKIVPIIRHALSECAAKLNIRAVSVFVFPTFSKFVKEKMFGTTGHTPWKRTMLVFISPNAPCWENALVDTVTHEYNHAVFLEYHQCESLLDALVMEGLAEHFREQVTDRGRAPWTAVLDESEVRILTQELKLLGSLGSCDHDLRRRIFFGDSKKYALWTGYAVGYHIVESFIKTNPKLSWTEIMTKSPRDIFARSAYAG
jgi:uncharacterized protein YjaZ